MNPSRDQRIVEDDAADRALLCAASGCPNRWSIASSRACSAHHWGDPRDWPRITDEQRYLATDRVIEAQRLPTQVRPLTRADKVAILQRLRDVLRNLGGGDPRAWARSLREREEAGGRLTSFQREAWRRALGVRDASIPLEASAEVLEELAA